MTPKLPNITGTKILRVLKKAGFEEVRQKGSHLHMKREIDKKRVTIPIHKGKSIPTGTLHSILTDADISVKKLYELL